MQPEGNPPEQTPPPAAPPPPPPPLPNRPPPVISAVPVARPARKGTGWKVLAIILLALLGLSFLFNVRHAAGDLVKVKGTSSQTSGPRLEEAVIKDNDSTEKIVVVNVDGVITGSVGEQAGGYSMVTVIKEELRLARRDKDVKAVILKVDSPG